MPCWTHGASSLVQESSILQARLTRLFRCCRPLSLRSLVLTILCQSDLIEDGSLQLRAGYSLD